MKCLITPQQVINLAFSSLDQITQDAIKETKIDAAQEVFLRPVLGEMFDALVDGKHSEFLHEYIHPALAYYVRYAIIPDLSLKLNNAGAQLFNSMHSVSASNQNRMEMRQQARDDANALLDKAIRYITANKDKFPEYKPQENVRNRITSNGGLILI